MTNRPWDPASIPTEVLADVEIVTDQLAFPEGPVAMSDGSVLVVDVDDPSLKRVDTDGSVEVVARCDGGPNGAAIGPDGAVYVCNNGGRYAAGDWNGGWIERIDLGTGDVEVLFTECEGRRLSGPNDIVFDESGGFWSTDIGKTQGRVRDLGSIHYVPSSLDAPVEVVHPAETPNGIGLSPDGTTLYWAETSTSRLRRRTIAAPGQVVEVGARDPSTLVVGLPGDQLFDSLAVDAAGTVCIGTLLAGCIVAVSADGASVVRHQLPPGLEDRMPTNICFGGPGLGTAYITLAEHGRLVRCPWPTRGLELAFSA